MRDIIIYVARWWEKYLSKRSPLKHTCSWNDKLIVILEIVGSNKNIFLTKNTVSCDKLGDTISTIDFKVTTDNQHVDSSIVTYKTYGFVNESFLYCIEINFSYCYWIALPCFITSIFTLVLVMGNKFKLVIMVKIM